VNRCQVCEGCQSMYGNPCAGCQAGGMCDGWLAQCDSGNCESERERWDDRTGDWDADTDREDYQ
jgi:hypothetical protein